MAGRALVRVKDLGSESFMVHHLCSSTEQNVLRLFDAHATRCNIAAELWSFESLKQFVLQDVGLAFVPRITVQQEIADGTLVSIPVQELDMKRKTFMVFRKSGYVSDAAQQFIDVISQFRWNDSLVQPVEPAVASRRGLGAVRQRKLTTAS
jgi:DNA-binding transcriptional LysR family regulator